MKQSENNPKMLTLLGILGIAAVYVLLIKPQAAELSEARDDRVSAQRNVDDALSILAEAGATDSGEGSATSEELALSLAVPPSPELSKLLRDLESIAAESGVGYASISPTAPGPNPAGPGSSVPLTINASGPPDAIAQYLGRIRDLERMLVIEQVSTLTSPGAAPVTQMQLSVRAYSTASPATAPSD